MNRPTISVSMNRLIVSASAAAVLGSAPAALAVDINGGSSWGGWTSVGQSNQLGVYGSGSTSEVYEVYKTVFSFNNNTKTGSPVGGGPTGGTTGFGTGTFSTGAFANGNTILGIGVRRISGSDPLTVPTVRFDLNANSYQPATSVGGGDGRTSFTSWSQTGDFTVQFNNSNWRGEVLTLQAGNGTSNGGPNNQQQIVGGSSGVNYDWPFRAFAQPITATYAGSYQMFFDLNAIKTLYGISNPFGLNANFTGIGTIGDPIRISLNGLGNNNVVFDAATTPPPAPAIPEPSSILGIAAIGLVGAGTLLRRKS